MKYKKEKRPWGEFEQFALNEKCTVKILTIYPNQMLSLQSHKKRSELWISLDGYVEVEIGNKKFRLKKGERVFIPKKRKHRLKSLGRKTRVLEISFGYFDEKDEKRYEDIYGRV